MRPISSINLTKYGEGINSVDWIQSCCDWYNFVYHIFTTPRTTDYRHNRQDRWIQTELVSTLAKNATKPNPFEITLLQTTRKENKWKTEETLERAVVTLETERIKGSNPWRLWWSWQRDEMSHIETRFSKLQLKNGRPTWCHLLFYFTSYVLNMFRTLIYPSSGACDCVGELPHLSSCSQFVVCWRFGAAGFE